jgi:hypothetical protein
MKRHDAKGKGIFLFLNSEYLGSSASNNGFLRRNKNAGNDLCRSHQ